MPRLLTNCDCKLYATIAQQIYSYPIVNTQVMVLGYAIVFKYVKTFTEKRGIFLFLLCYKVSYN